MKDSLLTDKIKTELKGEVFGQVLQIFGEVPSTMDIAKALGKTNSPEGTVILADTQTHGRGRHSRAWFSPAGKNIYGSIIFRPKYSLEETQRLLCLAIVATCQMISEQCGIKPKIKWPNDLVINDKKIAGFLLQNEIKGSELDFCILGVGINVNMVEKDLPPELVGLASSLHIETGRIFPRSTLVASLLNLVEHWYTILNKEGFNKIKNTYLAYWQQLDQLIKIRQPGRTINGLGVELDDCGYVVVELENGNKETIYVGDPV